jgi:hypothetical protein
MTGIIAMLLNIQHGELLMALYLYYTWIINRIFYKIY